MNISLNKLLFNIDVFHKNAGLLKAPEMFLKQISDWVISCFCVSLLPKLGDKIIDLTIENNDSKKLHDILIAYGECERLSKKCDKNTIKNFEFSLSDFSYQSQYNPFGVDYNDRYFSINVKLINSNEEKIKIEPGDWNGLYVTKFRGPIGTIYIYKNIEDFSKIIINDTSMLIPTFNAIKRTVRHEILHFVQEFLGLIFMSDSTGLPGKHIRDLHFDPSGMPKHKDADLSLIDPEDPYGRIFHEFRDVEFYTRLSDSIDIFNIYKRYFPLSLHSAYAKAWVKEITPEYFINILKNTFKENFENFIKYANRAIKTICKKNEITDNIKNLIEPYEYDEQAANYFFSQLKEKQPLKYRKAIIEFIKAINI